MMILDRQDLEKSEQLSDDEVALLAQGGDGQALVYLLDKYKNFVRARARSYFLIGADRRGHRPGRDDRPVQGHPRL